MATAGTAGDVELEGGGMMEWHAAGDYSLITLFIYSNKQSESAHSLEMTVKPHNGTIHCCVFSSDGKTILSSSSDGTAKVISSILFPFIY